MAFVCCASSHEQEDRRKEILAKLSSERQAALKACKTGSPVYSADAVSPEASPAPSHSSFKTPEERSQVLQKLFQARKERSSSQTEEAAAPRSPNLSDRHGHRAVLAASPMGSPPSDGSADSERHSQAFSDDGELFYASDIIGNGVTAEIQPRSRMDLLYEQDEFGEREADDAELGDEGVASISKSLEMQHGLHEGGGGSNSGAESAGKGSSSSSLFAKVLARESEGYPNMNEHHAQAARPRVSQDDAALFGQYEAKPVDSTQPARRRTVPQSEREQSDSSPGEPWTPSKDQFAQYHGGATFPGEFVPGNEPFQHGTRRATTGTAISKRIEFLAQPRNDKFTELEKQRLVLEMENFQECTFRPDITKSQQRLRTRKDQPSASTKSEKIDPPVRQSRGAFPWLMLSPRRRSIGDARARVQWCDLERPQGQSVIQRLHLDGTARYEQRELAKAELEALKLRECTFKPKMNSTSRSMLSIGGYKPIHERVSDIQRAKVRHFVSFELLSKYLTFCW